MTAHKRRKKKRLMISVNIIDIIWKTSQKSNTNKAIICDDVTTLMFIALRKYFSWLNTKQYTNTKLVSKSWKVKTSLESNQQKTAICFKRINRRRKKRQKIIEIDIWHCRRCFFYIEQFFFSRIEFFQHATNIKQFTFSLFSTVRKYTVNTFEIWER